MLADRRLHSGRRSRRAPSRKLFSRRALEFQKLEARQLLAGVGDWAMIDLRSYLTDTSTAFQDLSGVVFHGNRLAVTANVQPNGAPAEARLLVVDYDLDASTAMDVGEDMKIPSLNGQAGGKTVASAVSSDGSAVYVTGNSLSPRASVHGEAYRAVWDGNQMTNVGLGSIPGVYSQNPVYQSFGYAVNAHGVVAGISDQGRAIFEYDQAMVHVAELTTERCALGNLGRPGQSRYQLGCEYLGAWSAATPGAGSVQ